jgi:hypothetical protein
MVITLIRSAERFGLGYHGTVSPVWNNCSTKRFTISEDESETLWMGEWVTYDANGSDGSRLDNGGDDCGAAFGTIIWRDTTLAKFFVSSDIPYGGCLMETGRTLAGDLGSSVIIRDCYR